MWTVTLAATSLTTHPAPFHEEKNSTKLKDCHIFKVIKVLGVFKHWCSFIPKRKKLIFFNISYLHSGKS